MNSASIGSSGGGSHPGLPLQTFRMKNRGSLVRPLDSFLSCTLPALFILFMKLSSSLICCSLSVFCRCLRLSSTLTILPGAFSEMNSRHFSVSTMAR